MGVDPIEHDEGILSVTDYKGANMSENKKGKSERMNYERVIADLLGYYRAVWFECTYPPTNLYGGTSGLILEQIERYEKRRTKRARMGYHRPARPVGSRPVGSLA